MADEVCVFVFDLGESRMAAGVIPWCWQRLHPSPSFLLSNSPRISLSPADSLSPLPPFLLLPPPSSLSLTPPPRDGRRTFSHGEYNAMVYITIILKYIIKECSL